MNPLPATKMPYVAVPAAPASICPGRNVDTLDAGGALHAPTASVSQRVMVTGRTVAPVSAVAVMAPEIPTFATATASTPMPVGPGMLVMPSPVRVAATATTSGVG